MRSPALFVLILLVLGGCSSAEQAAPPAQTPETEPAPSTGSAPALSPTSTPESDSAAVAIDMQQARAAIETRVSDGTATEQDLRMLKAICSHQGDRACRDAAAARLAGGAPAAEPNEPKNTNKEEELKQMRAALEGKAWDGQATVDELRMLKAICSHHGDRVCRDRAAALLRKAAEAR